MRTDRLVNLIKEAARSRNKVNLTLRGRNRPGVKLAENDHIEEDPKKKKTGVNVDTITVNPELRSINQSR